MLIYVPTVYVHIDAGRSDWAYMCGVVIVGVFNIIVGERVLQGTKQKLNCIIVVFLLIKKQAQQIEEECGTIQKMENTQIDR
jgi:ABC-type uncharacterized transport system permease subunit